MTPRVRRDRAWARKALTDPAAARSGFRLASRSRLLAARGVRTPIARYDARAQELVFPWIAGTSGLDMLHCKARDAAGGDPVSEDLLAACLLPLVRLHGVDPAGLDLGPLDPWRRIDPRLLEMDAEEACKGPSPIDCAAIRARRSTERRLVEIGARVKIAEQVVVHGDYHVGQLLFASPTDEAWLLDLDDLALAPRESDLGNFAAHLATFDECAGGILDRFRGLASLLCLLHKASTEQRVDRDMIEAYGAIALLRRGLKLRERGASTGVVLDLLSAAERLSRGPRLGRHAGAPASLPGAGRRLPRGDGKTAEA